MEKFSEFVRGIQDTKLNEATKFSVPSDWPEDGIDDLQSDLQRAGGSEGRNWEFHVDSKDKMFVILHKPNKKLLDIMKSFRLKKA